MDLWPNCGLIFGRPYACLMVGGRDFASTLDSVLIADLRPYLYNCGVLLTHLSLLRFRTRFTVCGTVFGRSLRYHKSLSRNRVDCIKTTHSIHSEFFLRRDDAYAQGGMCDSIVLRCPSVCLSVTQVKPATEQSTLSIVEHQGLRFSHQTRKSYVNLFYQQVAGNKIFLNICVFGDPMWY